VPQARFILREKSANSQIIHIQDKTAL